MHASTHVYYATLDSEGRRNCAILVEVGSRKPLRHSQSGQVGEWLKPTDCKSVPPCEVRRFESFPVHHECGSAVVAQLVEHFLGKEEVTGPIPVNGSSSGFGHAQARGMRFLVEQFSIETVWSSRHRLAGGCFLPLTAHGSRVN